jgi:hypothetical protein
MKAEDLMTVAGFVAAGFGVSILPVGMPLGQIKVEWSVTSEGELLSNIDAQRVKD